MPSYKLTYFDLSARGEVTRLLFKQANVPFEDERIAFAEWPKLKTNADRIPCGMLPVLQVDGNLLLVESLAIARYVARETGQYGDTNVEGALIDAVVYILNEVVPLWAKVWFSKSDADKKAAFEGFDEGIKKILTNLEKMLSQNNEGNGWFVGTKPTFADMMACAQFVMVTDIKADSLDATPKLKGLFQRVKELPRIKAYLAK